MKILKKIAIDYWEGLSMIYRQCFLIHVWHEMIDKSLSTHMMAQLKNERVNANPFILQRAITETNVQWGMNSRNGCF